MTDDVPTTATAAAPLLAAAADAPGNPTARLLPGERPDELDPWELLTRRHLPPKLQGRMAQSRAAYEARHPSPVRADMAPVVVMLPATYLTAYGRHGWAPMERDPDTQVLADDGYPGWAYRVGPADPVQPTGRARWCFVGAPEGLPPEPRTTQVLAVATLGARHAADLVSTWAETLTAGASRKARDEAAAYRTYADRCEALIGQSATWLAPWLSRNAGPRPAFPTVPATPWGTASTGTT